MNMAKTIAGTSPFHVTQMLQPTRHADSTEPLYLPLRGRLQ